MSLVIHCLAVLRMFNGERCDDSHVQTLPSQAVGEMDFGSCLLSDSLALNRVATHVASSSID